MTGRLRTSRAGLELIKSFEGFRDAAIRLPDGRWMIGYGHVRTAREGLKISEKDAEDLLAHDLKPIEDAIYGMVYAPLNQGQFDALVSLGFNIGVARLRDSDVISNLNAGDFVSASRAFGVWRKARIHGRVMVVDALVRRRAAEKAMFLEHPAGRPSAPSPLVVPEADIEIGNGEMASHTHSEPPGQLAAAAGAATSLDMAEAVRRLAERTQGIVSSPGASVPPAAAEASADESEASYPHTPPRTPGEIEQAQRMVAERLARILERAEQQPGIQAAAASAARPGRVVSNSVSETRSNGRALIDDTETFNPGRDPAEIFAEAERNDRVVKGRAKRMGLFNGRIIALMPWIFILILSILGFSIGLVEIFRAPAEGALASAPTILAVFGMLVLMSLYYLITRAGADEI